jgi:hypothetical protein
MTLPTLKMAMGVTPVFQKSTHKATCVTKKHTEMNRAMVLAELMSANRPCVFSHPSE